MVDPNFALSVVAMVVVAGMVLRIRPGSFDKLLRLFERLFP